MYLYKGGGAGSMRSSGNQQHVPIEIMRTIVAIFETGSLSKAGEKLGISQPAVSSQIKRIELMIGGEVFDKTSNGTTGTELGKLVLQQARKILEANDQLLRLGASRDRPETIRFGIATLFAPDFLKTPLQDSPANLMIHTDSSARTAKQFVDGFIDVACFCATSDTSLAIEDTIIETFAIEMVWLRSADFRLSPGRPIPLLGWPGLVTDDMMIRALENRGLAYRIVFNSADYQARSAAAEAGLGLTAGPLRFAPSYLMPASDLFLPELPPLTVYVCARPGLQSERATELIATLSRMFRLEP